MRAMGRACALVVACGVLMGGGSRIAAAAGDSTRVAPPAGARAPAAGSKAPTFRNSAPPLGAVGGKGAPHPGHPGHVPSYPHYGARPTGIKSRLEMSTVTLHVFHRVFRQFHDKVDARLHREFRIGDSDYTGTVTEFVPDFVMDLKSHRVTSRSDEPRNPAFHIVVRKKGVPQDTTWAFLDLPPHFAEKSLVAFLATQVTFTNHAAVASKDTLAVRLKRLGLQ